MKPIPVTRARVEEFRAAVAAIIDRQRLASASTVGVDYGRRYAKIWHRWGGQTLVWGFVDLTSGDILKAEGWKKPAMHARGSLHTPNMDVDKMAWTGPPYL